jgi:hypothetical protein
MRPCVYAADSVPLGAIQYSRPLVEDEISYVERTYIIFIVDQEIDSFLRFRTAFGGKR